MRLSHILAGAVAALSLAPAAFAQSGPQAARSAAGQGESLKQREAR